MLLRRPTTVSAAISHYITAAISLHFSTTTATTIPTKPFSKIPWKHRSKAIYESQKALTDYLHTTRSLPFLYAEHIATNSPQSLSKIVSKIPFSRANFVCNFQRFLRYHPVNELDFFVESIGLNFDVIENPCSFFPQNTVFLSDWKQFDVACALACMGFPWCKLNLLCKDEFLIFETEPSELGSKVNRIKDVYGLDGVSLIGICLAFPRVLYCDMDGLLSDLKILFVDHDFSSCVEGSVDAMLEVCEKIRVFYDLGCEMGNIGELLGRSKSIFVKYSKEYLISKIEYFCKFNVPKDEIGLFLLSRPEIFAFDLEVRVISVSGFLKHFGLRKDELELLEEKFPHVFGRNRIANLPFIMRSMDLGEWFFEKMKNDGNHSLLGTYAIQHIDEDLDKNYEQDLKKIRAKRTYAHATKKLNFLHGIGFGENKFTVKALTLLNSSGCQLQKRFDHLLKCGIGYSRLCAMLKLSAKILNQQEDILEKKLDYLLKDLGSSLDYLDVFPAYLCYDLEKRIKPRYDLHKWLVENGFCEKEYSLSTIIASSEKTFVARISRIHPDAAKMWQEDESRKDSSLSQNSVP